MMVPGEGPVPARVMIVGEAPGFEEERSGHPRVALSRFLHHQQLAHVLERQQSHELAPHHDRHRAQAAP